MSDPAWNPDTLRTSIHSHQLVQSCLHPIYRDWNPDRPIIWPTSPLLNTVISSSAWASLAQTGSYLQRSAGCLVTLDKASLPWERLDSRIQRLFRANSAPLWHLRHITTTQRSAVGSWIYFGSISALISGNSHLCLFLRWHIFLYVYHCWTQATEMITFLWFILDLAHFIRDVCVSTAVCFRLQCFYPSFFVNLCLKENVKLMFCSK